MNKQQQIQKNKINFTNQAYEDYLYELSDEQLWAEFCDQIGNELEDFERLMSYGGRFLVVQQLTDKFNVDQYEESLK